MMRRTGLIAAVMAVLAGCSAPANLPNEGPENPAIAASAPAPHPSDGLAEPVMETVVMEERSAGSAAWPQRRQPARRPVSPERCDPGDDGIGGTGCPVD